MFKEKETVWLKYGEGKVALYEMSEKGVPRPEFLGLLRTKESKFNSRLMKSKAW